jgi:hypothetical protein
LDDNETIPQIDEQFSKKNDGFVSTCSISVNIFIIAVRVVMWG